MKQRYSSLDVKVIAHELSQTLTSLRISNIYDLSSRIFLFKCAKPGTKTQLLVDSGFRAHLTSFQRTANPTPSAFVARLRKYLKTRRITSVSQLGTDRVIEITFSDGQYRLFLEFFAAGNIVLTDAELNVLTLFRQVNEGDEDVDVKLGGKYVLEAKQNFHGVPELSRDRVKDVLQKQIAKIKEIADVGGKKSRRHKGSDDLRKALSIGFSEYPIHLLDHCFVETGIDETLKASQVLDDESAMEKVMEALEKARSILQSLDTGEGHKGYIVAKEKDSKANSPSPSHDFPPPRDALLYDDFHPFNPSQFRARQGVHVLEIDGFNKAVDEFYSSIESQKLESRLTEREEAAKKKLDSAKHEHEKRLGALQQAQELHVRKAQTIEANTHRVEEAIAAVNGLVSQGMDWVDIGKLIENEQGRNNMVAEMIKLPLKLHENTVTLLLDEPGIEDDSESDEDDKTDSESDSDDAETKKIPPKPAKTEKRLAIDIDLAMTPWANARQYYDQKKFAGVKQQKTILASDKALKSMSQKIEADLKKGLKQEKAALRPARRQFWFEKFLWFISSDGYLVIGGKDAQQNELIYRRYLKKGDVYVHADLQGASSVVVKNNPTTPNAPIPPSTLSQAGALTVCTSSAWDSKAVMAAWWVNAEQVSKTAETGEYLRTGGFMIRGKKVFLPPTQLILGFGIMWLISEASRANHSKNRIARTESMVEGEAEFLAEDAKNLSIENEVEESSVVVATHNDNAGNESDDAAQDSDEEEDKIEEQDDLPNASEDEGSNLASDNELPRSNPLQADHHTIRNNSDKNDDDDDDDEDQSENEAENMQDQDTVMIESDTTKIVAAEQNAPRTKDQIQSARQISSQSKQAKPKRGANTKAKRAAAKKYALQDDEERELALSLLGSTKGADKRAAAEEARAAREAKAAADKERRKQQHDRAAQAEKARQERLAKAEANGQSGVAGADDDDNDLDPEQIEIERKELLNIDLFVPYPQPGDELIAAIPVVAPWTSLARNKYKVKLQPGSVKKGKAVREIINNWVNLGTRGPKVVDETNSDKDKVWVREVDCLKALRVEEVIGVVPVKGVRIVQSGGASGVLGAAGSGGGGGGGAGDGKGKGKGSVRGGKGGKKSGR